MTLPEQQLKKHLFLRKGNVKGPNKLTVYDPNDVAKTTIKETLIHNSRKGNLTVTTKNRVYAYDTKPKITIRSTRPDFKQNLSRANGPNKSTVTVQDKLKKTIRETTENNVHTTNVQYNKGIQGHTTNPADAPFTQKQFLSDYEYMELRGSGLSEAKVTITLCITHHLMLTSKRLLRDANPGK